MRFWFSGMVVLLSVSTADAHWKRPRLAAMAMPGAPFTPQYAEPVSSRPWARAIPKLVAGVSLAASFAPSPISLVGSAVPVTIRLLHVIANGSPTPGRPGKTAAWLISPYGQQAVTRFRERRFR